MKLAVAFVYAMGSVVCHQRPDRSFFWDGQQWPVCARCSGLYLGAAAAFLAWLIVRAIRRSPIAVDPRRALSAAILAAVPTGISWSAGVLGIWDGTNVIRAVLALPLGVAAGAIVAAVATKDLR